jgi:universal stress protein family protein
MRYSAIIVGTDGSASALKAAASDMTATLVKGDPGRAVVTTASERAADLNVVGNRGINPLSGRLLGSVPSDVSRWASCDVGIVHTMKGGPRNPGSSDDTDN